MIAKRFSTKKRQPTGDAATFENCRTCLRSRPITAAPQETCNKHCTFALNQNRNNSTNKMKGSATDAHLHVGLRFAERSLIYLTKTKFLTTYLLARRSARVVPQPVLFSSVMMTRTSLSPSTFRDFLLRRVQARTWRLACLPANRRCRHNEDRCPPLHTGEHTVHNPSRNMCLLSCP